jgi:hypothetical protein
MKGLRRIGVVGMLGVAVALLGCVSTPQSRIKANPALFASFPPEAQAKIKEGVVEIGFSRDMARIALGSPDQISTRSTAKGKTEIWSYMGVRYSSLMEPVEYDYWYRSADGRLHRATDWSWAHVEHRHEYPTLRIEFEDDKVTGIEKLQ